MIRLLLLIAALSMTPVLAQDAADAETEPASEAPEPAEETAEELPDIEDELDDLLYPVEDEDAFIPSENVAFGQSIPFPTDI